MSCQTYPRVEVARLHHIHPYNLARSRLTSWEPMSKANVVNAVHRLLADSFTIPVHTLPWHPAVRVTRKKKNRKSAMGDVEDVLQDVTH